ncbi:MAG: hypothetical protein VYE18_09485 [Pseudomonadota bacterium]|nr:hypothetical protein [Pseudomonadota bacterium]
MKQVRHTLKLKTSGQGFYETTRSLNIWPAYQDIGTGMLAEVLLNNPVADVMHLLGTWLGICFFDRNPIPHWRKSVQHLSGE